MALLWVLRIALYLTFLLGIGRFFELVPNQVIWNIHILLGVLIVLLALVALRPRLDVSGQGLRRAARFFPLLPLTLGLAMLAEVLPRDLAVRLVHMALGIATLGLVDAAAARQRRARRARSTG